MVGVGTGSAQAVSIHKAIKEDKVAQWLVPGGFYHPFLSIESGMGMNAATITGPTADASGNYYTRTNDQGIRKWYIPEVATGDVAAFGTQQMGAILTKQCFKQNVAGVYEIDSAKTPSASGYELIKTSDTGKLLTPPVTNGHVKPGPKVKE